MTKVKIIFDLDNLDDAQKLKRVLKADDMAFTLHELLRNTKKGLEWGLENKEIDKYETLEYVFDRIWEIVNDHNINIDEILN
jgi:hypothetical protein